MDRVTERILKATLDRVLAQLQCAGDGGGGGQDSKEPCAATVLVTLGQGRRRI